MVKDNPTAQQVKTTDQQIKEVIDQITKEVKIEWITKKIVTIKDNRIVQRTKIEHKDNKTVLAGQGQQNRPAQGQQNRPNQGNQSQNRPAQGQQSRPNQGASSQGTQSRPAGDNQNRGGNQNRGKSNYNGRNNNFNNNNRNKFNKKGKKGRQQQEKKPPVPARKFRELPEVLEYTEGMNVADIAKKIYREPAEIIKKLFMMGVMVNQNQPLDKDTIELLATDYGIEPQEKFKSTSRISINSLNQKNKTKKILSLDPPVVTIMDTWHGNNVLDTLRHSRVTSGEAGGITQHIGAYQIDIDGKPITFLDTPGQRGLHKYAGTGEQVSLILRF